MRTEDLIQALSRDVEPTAPMHALWRLWMLAVAGFVVAGLLTAFLLGVRPDYVEGLVAPDTAMKFAFTAGVAIATWPALIRVARAGELGGWRRDILGLPFAAIALAATIQLGFARYANWSDLFFDQSWSLCLPMVTLLSLPIYLAVGLVLRRMAPVDLSQAGFVAGLFAGGLGALAYTLHCQADDMPYVAVFYSLAILVAAALGGLAGPRILRW